MVNFTIHLSSIEPTTIENKTVSSAFTQEDGGIAIPMLPVNAANSDINIEILLRKTVDNYVHAVFGPDSPYISWERTYIEFENSDKISPQSSITIEFKNPVNGRRAESYWGNSTVSAKNSGEITEHYPFIVKNFFSDGFNLGEIPESSSGVWERTVPETYTHIETQPIVRPGEYLSLKWELRVNGKTFTSLSMICPYDTPLFTGGWITGKTGEGVDVRYSVEVFGDIITNIIPTDFYDYQVGKWVYLMKTVTLTLDPDQDNKQMYGSSGISSDNSSSVSTVFTDTNSERVLLGLDPLTINSKLNTMAQLHADDMARNTFVSHDGSDGSTTASRFEDSNYSDGYVSGEDYLAGENVAGYYQPSVVVDEWMGSPGHRANIINTIFEEIGIGVAIGADGYYYYCQVFGYKSWGDGDSTYDGNYRIVPFNFKGPMNTECAVPYEDAIDLDSAINFEEVFDMITYESIISNIDYDNDTATVTTSTGEVQDDVPIFYYCDGSITDVAGGAGAFTDGDQVIVQAPESGDTSQFKIIGFPDEIKICGDGYLYCESNHGDCFFWDMELNNYAENIKDNNGQTIVSWPIEISNITNFKSRLTAIGSNAIQSQEIQDDIIWTGGITYTGNGVCLPSYDPNRSIGNWLGEIEVFDENGDEVILYYTRETEGEASYQGYINTSTFEYPAVVDDANCKSHELTSLSNVGGIRGVLVSKNADTFVSDKWGYTIPLEFCDIGMKWLTCPYKYYEDVQEYSYVYEIKSPFSEGEDIDFDISVDINGIYSIDNYEYIDYGLCSGSEIDGLDHVEEELLSSEFKLKSLIVDSKNPYMIVAAQNVREIRTITRGPTHDDGTETTDETIKSWDVFSGKDTGTPPDPMNLNPFELPANNDLRVAIENLVDDELTKIEFLF